MAPLDGSSHYGTLRLGGSDDDVILLYWSFDYLYFSAIDSFILNIGCYSVDGMVGGGHFTRSCITLFPIWYVLPLLLKWQFTNTIDQWYLFCMDTGNDNNKHLLHMSVYQKCTNCNEYSIQSPHWASFKLPKLTFHYQQANCILYRNHQNTTTPICISDNI